MELSRRDLLAVMAIAPIMRPALADDVVPPLVLLYQQRAIGTWGASP